MKMPQLQGAAAVYCTNQYYCPMTVSRGPVLDAQLVGWFGSLPVEQPGYSTCLIRLQGRTQVHGHSGYYAQLSAVPGKLAQA